MTTKNPTIVKISTSAIAAAKRFLYRRGYEILADNIENKTIVCLDSDTVVIVHVQQDERCAFTRGEFEDALMHYTSEKLIPTNVSVRFDELTIDIVDVDRATIKYHRDAAKDGRITDWITADAIAKTSTKEIKGLIDLLTHELVVRGED